jgi:hypothetical protein
MAKIRNFSGFLYVFKQQEHRFSFGFILLHLMGHISRLTITKHYFLQLGA